MENESSVITIAKSAKYESDKSTFTERCTFFDIGWYVVSAAASIWKLQVTSQSNFSDSIVFIVLFVTPVCVKHVLAFDIYKGMRSSVDSTIFFNFINHLSNYILFISFFSKFIFLSLFIFWLSSLIDFSNLSFACLLLSIVC